MWHSKKIEVMSVFTIQKHLYIKRSHTYRYID